MKQIGKENNSIWKRFIDFILKFLFIDLFKRKSAPHAFVLFVDTILSAICYWLVVSFNGNPTENIVSFPYAIPTKIFIVSVVYMFINLLVKNYKYTIRLPIIEDMSKTAILVVSASFTLILTALLIEKISDVRYFSIWNIFVAGFMSFTIMMCMRLITKHLYSMHVDKVGNSIPIIILGNDISTITLAHTLKNEHPRRYNPQAILSTEIFPLSKVNFVNGFKIYPFSENSLKELSAEYECDSILIPDKLFDVIKTDYADELLRHGFKLFIINHVSEFISNEGTSSTAHVERIKIEDLLGRRQIKINHNHLANFINGKKVIITGAAGSIGSEITRQVAVMNPNSIILVDQAETPMHSLMLEINEKYKQAPAEYIISDITDSVTMDKLFEKYRPDIVLHAAAYKHVPMMEFNPTEAVRNNIFGTKIIADLAIKYGVKKFIMISTDKAVNPTNVMGATKRAAEIYVQSLFHTQNKSQKTQFITTRFGNVLGSNGSVIPLFKKQIENGGPVTITDKNIIRYFMTIDEACSLVLEASCIGEGGEIFIFDMGTPVKIYDLAKNMITLAGLTVDKDIKIIETGLRPGEKLYEELLYDKEKSIPTSNKKILKSITVQYDYQHVAELMSTMNDFVHSDDEEQTVRTLKKLVPEYKSEHSKWEKLDN